jgi:hypothetical protein
MAAYPTCRETFGERRVLLAMSKVSKRPKARNKARPPKLTGCAARQPAAFVNGGGMKLGSLAAMPQRTTCCGVRETS